MSQKGKPGPAEYAGNADKDEHFRRILRRYAEQLRDDRRSPQKDAIDGRAGADPSQHRQPETPLFGNQSGDSGITMAVRTARMIGRKPTAASPRQPTSGSR